MTVNVHQLRHPLMFYALWISLTSCFLLFSFLTDCSCVLSLKSVWERSEGWLDLESFPLATISYHLISSQGHCDVFNELYWKMWVCVMISVRQSGRTAYWMFSTSGLQDKSCMCDNFVCCYNCIKNCQTLHDGTDIQFTCWACYLILLLLQY